MRLLAALFPILLALLLLVLVGAVKGFFIMLLWNYLLVGASSIIGVSLPALTWFKGWMLAILVGMVMPTATSSSSSS